MKIYTISTVERYHGVQVIVIAESEEDAIKMAQKYYPQDIKLQNYCIDVSIRGLEKGIVHAESY